MHGSQGAEAAAGSSGITQTTVDATGEAPGPPSGTTCPVTVTPARSTIPRPQAQYNAGARGKSPSAYTRFSEQHPHRHIHLSGLITVVVDGERAQPAILHGKQQIRTRPVDHVAESGAVRGEIGRSVAQGLIAEVTNIGCKGTILPERSVELQLRRRAEFQLRPAANGITRQLRYWGRRAARLNHAAAQCGPDPPMAAPR